MRNRIALLCVASATMCAWPLLAAAQQEGGFLLEEAPEKEPIVIHTNEIELGGGWVSSDSFKFGEYSGHQESGPFGIGNVQIIQRSDYAGRDTEYWEVFGSNLGFESRSFSAEYGRQGTFSLFLDFDQIPHYRLDDARTPFRGAGSDNLTLPAGWVSATSTAGMTELAASLKDVEIETERMRYGGGFSWNLGQGFAFTGAYHREEKDGLETIAGMFGSAGGGPNGPLAAILPLPIDQVTQTGDLSLTYAGEKLHAQLTYNLSLLNNHEDSLTWQNPWDALGGYPPTQDFDEGGIGRLAQDPDNSAHQVALAASYPLGEMTNITGNFAYGWMRQDDDFLPYTVLPELAAGAVPLPRSSLDGEVHTMHGNLNVATRPARSFDIKARYTFDDRDNETPRDVYRTIPGDENPQEGLASSRARINRPYSRTSHEANVDASVRILPRTKITTGYDFEWINRDLSEVENSYEHTGRVKLRTALNSFASAWAEYAFSHRDDGGDYDSNEPFLVSHTPEFLAGESADELFEQNPFLRKYYFADRNRHRVRGAVTLTPFDMLSLGFSGSYSHSDYDDTTIGLTQMDYASGTADVSLMPIDAVTMSAFVTLERMFTDQTGYDRGSAAISPTTVLDPTVFWMTSALDRSFTTGAELEWEAVKDTLDLAIEYLFQRTVTDYDISSGTGASSATPLPDLKSRMHSVGFRGDYAVREGMKLRFIYRYEWFESDDFALNGVDPGTISTVISLGNDSPDYAVHIGGVSVVWSF